MIYAFSKNCFSKKTKKQKRILNVKYLCDIRWNSSIFDGVPTRYSQRAFDEENSPIHSPPSLSAERRRVFHVKLPGGGVVKKYTYTFAITKIIESTENYEHFGCTNNVVNNWLIQRKVGVSS